MAEGTVLVRVPLEDGDIQRAFDNLDAQMDAWLAAMRHAEQALAGAADRRSPAADEFAVAPATEDSPQEPPPAADDSAVVFDQAEEVPSMQTAPEAVASADQSIPRGETPSETTTVGVEPLPDRAAAQAAEDEALLATLDPETVQAIRVMRRMCMNSKSVKELLVEYQARKTTQAEGGAKKSWFRRGK